MSIKFLRGKEECKVFEMALLSQLAAGNKDNNGEEGDDLNVFVNVVKDPEFMFLDEGKKWLFVMMAGDRK